MSYKIRGPLTPDDDVPYILRPADADLLKTVQKVDYVALIGPRLSGKTSMAMRLCRTLQPMPRFVVAYVNLSAYQRMDEERWYSAVYNEMVASSEAKLPAPRYAVQDAVELREVLLHNLKGALAERVLVVILDDVETVPLEIRTGFFALLREMFVSRGLQLAFRRISFVLAGSYIPDELIPDPTISPFRVAEKIYVEDATDISPLVNPLNRPQRPMAADVPARIMDWTEGDLYLTQRLCERLDAQYPEGTLTPSAVDQTVERFLYDDDIFDSLEKKLRTQPRVGRVLRDVVMEETSLRFTRTSQAIAYAWLWGCIKPNRFGNCTARNGIYENLLRQMIQRVVEKADPNHETTMSIIRKRDPQPLKGRYLLESAIRRGTLTHLYRARDLSTDQVVAVKQLLSMRGGDVIVWRRFQREGDALKRLDHPHIVKFIDSFREGDYNYIVMEFVDGGTLDGLLNREGRQPLELIINIMVDVADALHHSHSHHIIHRDIKPSNILLTQSFSPRLADFGVAHFANQAERLTSPYSVVGTPVYLSPEAYDTSVFSPTEDVWSLGVTIYEMLTGVLPFNGRTHEHIRHAILHAPIPNVRDIRPDVPESVAEILFHMLQRDPQRRLQNGQAVKEALLSLQASIQT